VSFTASPPRRSRSQTCGFLPSRPERNARVRPSGLKRGLDSGFFPLVTRIALPPAKGTMNTSVSDSSALASMAATV
jgi:hypothetical protein